MNMIDWYKKVVFENYANFSGRARRSEYWYYTLCNIIIVVALMIPMFTALAMSDTNGGEPGILFYISIILICIYYLATFLPTLAVSVRRLHDTGKSGWYYLVNFIPYVGGLIFLVLTCQDSDIYTNQWGSNPKAPADEINDIGLTNQI